MTRRTPVIIDTDPGVDDALAILLALASPEIEILAFVVTFGNSDRDSCYQNIFRIYNAIERQVQAYPEEKIRFPNVYNVNQKPLLARGPDHPLNGPLHSAEYFHGRDGLGEISDRHPELDPVPELTAAFLDETDEFGTDVALRFIREFPPRSITYVALGPLTNLAAMLAMDSQAVRERIGLVVSMGGALDIPGNTTPVAEFNFYADPFAVEKLLALQHPGIGFPMDRFLLLPLDITTRHQLRFPQYIRTVDSSFRSTAHPSEPFGKQPLTHFTSSFLERTREIMLSFGNDAVELHDIVAVWCAIENPPSAEGSEHTGLPILTNGWKAVPRIFQIERTGELTRGMLVVDRRDDQSVFLEGVNRSEAQATVGLAGFLPQTFNAVIPARVEVETVEELKQRSRGVPCVLETPGCAALLSLMMERIWNVRRQEESSA